MSPRLEVRPAGGAAAPDYPGIAFEPAPIVRVRYGESVLERMRRGLSRPLIVLGLYAGFSLPAIADDEDPRDPPRREVRSPGEEPTLRMLSRGEIAGLVGGLERLQTEVIEAVDGDVQGQLGFLTEEEGRSLLEALFKKNGYAVARDVRILGPGLDFTADAFDGARKAGFEYLGPLEPGAWEFQPAESDLGPEIAAELDLERARGGRAILVVDGRHYGYNVEYMDHLPSKAQAVDRLLDDVRRFLVWLAERRR